jgi:membrane protein required for colicin V production
MLWPDIAILIIIAFSSLISLLRGFVREALSLVVWIAAFWVGITFSDVMSNLLITWISDELLNKLASFALLFLLTLAVGGVTNYFVGLLIKKTGLSGTDRVVGVLFGLLRGGLVVTVLLLMLGYTTIKESDWWEESIFISHFEPWVEWMEVKVETVVGFSKSSES